MANTQINISQNGKTTLKTAGKYCDRNIDVNVTVPATGITPAGTLFITENGTHDVTEYESAVVNVPSKATQFTNLLTSDKVTITLNTAPSSSTTAARNGVFMIQLNLNDFAHTAGVKKTKFRWRGIYPDTSYPYIQQSADGATWSNNQNTPNYTIDECGDMCITMTNNYPTKYPYIRMAFRRLNAAMSSVDDLAGCILTAFEPIGNGGYVG